MNENKQILLINDLAGYGKVALSAMMPIFSNMGFEIFTLPTALVSNTLDYGKFEILDTKDYILNTVNVWEQLGFTFESIALGFIASDEEASILADFCAKQKEKGSFIFVDPIMGDDGSLYNGISKDAIESRRRLLEFADILVGDILNGKSLSDATSHSMEVVKKMIELNIDKADKYRGIPVEQYLELI